MNQGMVSFKATLKAAEGRSSLAGGFGGRSDRDFDGGRERRRGYGFGDGGYEDDRRGGSGFEDRRRAGGGGGFADTYGPDRGRPRDGGFGWAPFLSTPICAVLSSFCSVQLSAGIAVWHVFLSDLF